MPKRNYPTDVLTQAQVVLDAWKSINLELKMGELGYADLEADIAKAKLIQSQLNELETKLTDLHNQRDVLYTGIWDKAKRVRNGVKGIYGDDSPQYEMVGGTRRSDRKPPKKRKQST
jgi:hypothetical protein